MINNLETENIDSLLLDLSSGKTYFSSEYLNIILKNSCYYPASGTDVTPIFYFNSIQSFVYCDYTFGENEWIAKIAMELAGYELLNQQNINNLIKLNPINKISMGGYERQLQEIVKRVRSNSVLTIWKKGERYLTIIYISHEAVDLYKQIYLNNLITPKVIAIIQPGHTMGGNWTNFFDIKSAFFQTILCGQLPKYMLLGSYEGRNFHDQISFDRCNFVELSGSDETFRISTGEHGRYIFSVESKNLSRIDLNNNSEKNFGLLLETAIDENWCLRINCRYCNNWNYRSVLNKLNPEEIIRNLKSFSEQFLRTHKNLFRFLVHEVRNLENGEELIHQLAGTPSYTQIQSNIREDEHKRKIELTAQEEESERRRLLKLAATPEAIAERKAVRKQLREIKTSPQRKRKELSKLMVADFITRINHKTDSELLQFVTSPLNKISMRSAGGILYNRLSNFLRTKAIANDDKALLKKLAFDHSWHWKKLCTRLKINTFEDK